jgi:3-oxoacyl-[acyl-carrier-protein] synthase-3
MGTTIDGIGLAEVGWRDRKSALRLANKAAEGALRDAGVTAEETDVLVNCGLYRDRNLGEPALAALIQEDVSANPEDPHPGGHGTFSFDVANGTCGPLTALQIVDRLGRAGTVRRSLIVASDADPGHGLAEDFPFAPAGAAVVCGWADGDRGLGEVTWMTSTDGGAAFRSTVGRHGGRNLLEIERNDTFADLAGALACKVATQAMDRGSVSLADVSTIVLAPGDPALARTFVERLGIADERVVVADPRTHTASLLTALHAARHAGRLGTGALVLLVCASAGVTAGACTYRA